MAESDIPRKVLFSRRAREDIDAADSWWRLNRLERPDAIDDAIVRCLVMITTMPSLGLSVPSRSTRNVRRIVLDDVPYQLFYQVDGGQVNVLCLWDGRRETRPRF